MNDTHLTPVYVYSKQVQDNTIKCTNLSRKIDVDQVLDIISSLKQIGKKEILTILNWRIIARNGYMIFYQIIQITIKLQ